MVPVVGDTHRDLPGALPTRTIVSLEGEVIHATVPMPAPLGSKRHMAVWMDNGVRGRVTTPTRLIIVLTIVPTATTGDTSYRLILRHVCYCQFDLATVWICHADNLDCCKFVIRRPEALRMRLGIRTQWRGIDWQQRDIDVSTRCPAEAIIDEELERQRRRVRDLGADKGRGHTMGIGERDSRPAEL